MPRLFEGTDVKELDLSGCSKIRGNLSQLPPAVASVNLGGCCELTGNLSSVPSSVTNLNLAECSKIRGDIGVLGVLNLTVLNLANCDQVMGNITPHMVAWLSTIREKNLNGCGRLMLTGSKTKNEILITEVDLSNMDSLEGDLPTMNHHVTGFNLAGCKKVTGQISSLPARCVRRHWYGRKHLPTLVLVRRTSFVVNDSRQF